MRFQLVTTAAALLVASVAALPTPRPDNHGLLADTDDVVDDGTIEFIEARGLSEDDEASEGIVARSTEDAGASDAIEFIEVRSTENAEVSEIIEFLEARDEATEDEDVTEEIEVLQTRDVDADDEVSESIEVLEARSADDEDEVGEGNEPWIETRDTEDNEVLEARSAADEDAGEGNEWLEERSADDEDAGEGNEWLEARDVDDEVTEDIEILQARDVEDDEDAGEGNEWIEARDVDDEVTEEIETLQARDVEDDEDAGEGNEPWLEARDDEDDVTETIEEVGAGEVEARSTEAEVSDTTETIEEVDASDIDARSTETEGAIEARAVRVTEAAANFNFTTDFDSALDRLLAAIDDIPDEILEQGDEALHKWLVEHGYREGSEKLKRDDDTDALSLLTRGELAARASIWKIAKCVASIVQLLATTAVPAAKLLRIKKYIKALGGTKDAVKLLLGATTKAEKLKVGGEALVALAAELLGISTVKNNCF